MKVLLDTHALLWWLTDDSGLSATARQVIADESNEVFVSAASAWEIATKCRLGKLAGLPDLPLRLPELIAADGFAHLPMTYLHCLRAGGYAAAHRDPFDRMLAAQAILEGLVLVSSDTAFDALGARRLW